MSPKLTSTEFDTANNLCSVGKVFLDKLTTATKLLTKLCHKYPRKQNKKSSSRLLRRVKLESSPPKKCQLFGADYVLAGKCSSQRLSISRTARTLPFLASAVEETCVGPPQASKLGKFSSSPTQQGLEIFPTPRLETFQKKCGPKQKTGRNL